MDQFVRRQRRVAELVRLLARFTNKIVIITRCANVTG
jgi:hypothetical protein